MSPFEQWFSADWQKALRELPKDTEALSSGFSIHTSSWDRRAAYLLWIERGRPRAAWVEQMAPLYDKKAAPSNDMDDLLGVHGDSPPPVAPPADDLEDLLG